MSDWGKGGRVGKDTDLIVEGESIKLKFFKTDQPTDPKESSSSLRIMRFSKD